MRDVADEPRLELVRLGQIQQGLLELRGAFGDGLLELFRVAVNPKLGLSLQSDVPV